MRRPSHSITKVLEVRRRVLGEEHPDTLISMNNLAVLYRDQGKYAQAEPLCYQGPGGAAARAWARSIPTR